MVIATQEPSPGWAERSSSTFNADGTVRSFAGVASRCSAAPIWQRRKRALARNRIRSDFMNVGRPPRLPELPYSEAACTNEHHRPSAASSGALSHTFRADSSLTTRHTLVHAEGYNHLAD